MTYESSVIVIENKREIVWRAVAREQPAALSATVARGADAAGAARAEREPAARPARVHVAPRAPAGALAPRQPAQ